MFAKKPKENISGTNRENNQIPGKYLNAFVKKGAWEK